MTGKVKKLYLNTHRFVNSVTLPGFDGMPMARVFTFFYKGIINGAITTRSSAISFNLFVAIFPTLIFLFTLIPFIPIDDFQETLMSLLEDIIPQSAWESVHLTFLDIIMRPHSSWLSIGFVLALFFSTNGINSLIEAFNASYHSMETRGILAQRWVAFVLILVLAIMLILAITFITAGSALLQYLRSEDFLQDRFIYLLLDSLRWFVLVTLTYFGISIIYYWAPAKKRPFKFFSAGSSSTTFVIMLTNIGFNYYANNLATYNALYGSIGTLLLILLWIYFNSTILLIGFELNVSILNAKLGNKQDS
ncbi:MAG: YihY/virulence factor BrkB family protein [Bacteroidales bacterium]|jgi:membrane protein|nr:YihY/virulence factor BrkB family protein [Bacteroidales bacterium]